jgi:hypothetical protein
MTGWAGERPARPTPQEVTVNALIAFSEVLFRHAPSVIDAALITAASHTPQKLLTGIYLHIRTPPCYLYTQATACGVRKLDHGR